MCMRVEMSLCTRVLGTAVFDYEHEMSFSALVLRRYLWLAADIARGPQRSFTLLFLRVAKGLWRPSVTGAQRRSATAAAAWSLAAANHLSFFETVVVP